MRASGEEMPWLTLIWRAMFSKLYYMMRSGWGGCKMQIPRSDLWFWSHRNGWEPDHFWDADLSLQEQPQEETLPCHLCLQPGLSWALCWNLLGHTYILLAILRFLFFLESSFSPYQTVINKIEHIIWEGSWRAWKFLKLA